MTRSGLATTESGVDRRHPAAIPPSRRACNYHEGTILGISNWTAWQIPSSCQHPLVPIHPSCMLASSHRSRSESKFSARADMSQIRTVLLRRSRTTPRPFCTVVRSVRQVKSCIATAGPG
ncbi:hypothetical protein CALCODRAFT_82982 [Calocera cornea HHB12733]|uniref:Uncharacterized protein n=1 Tax=Calocera cornea HHB12733 TaxID=1353952 RepID=A0A165DDK5_9BASI|nr:hypothetical protein CALCODRAFT_82982 [Calocera cornea HHB12733]